MGGALSSRSCLKARWGSWQPSHLLIVSVLFVCWGDLCVGTQMGLGFGHGGREVRYGGVWQPSHVLIMFCWLGLELRDCVHMLWHAVPCRIRRSCSSLPQHNRAAHTHTCTHTQKHTIQCLQTTHVTTRHTPHTTPRSPPAAPPPRTPPGTSPASSAAPVAVVVWLDGFNCRCCVCVHARLF